MIKKPKKQKTIKQLEKQLRRILYPLIKKRDGNICTSCGKSGLEGADWQAGHFAKAELCSMKWRYDERNIHSQCSACNNWKDGNTIEFEKNLIEKYGKEFVDNIKSNYMKRQTKTQYSRLFLEEMIKYYKTVVKLAQL